MLLLFILVGLTCVIEGTDFSSPLDISSGSSSATSWALTLSVSAQYIMNSVLIVMIGCRIIHLLSLLVVTLVTCNFVFNEEQNVE